MKLLMSQLVEHIVIRFNFRKFKKINKKNLEYFDEKSKDEIFKSKEKINF